MTFSVLMITAQVFGPTIPNQHKIEQTKKLILFKGLVKNQHFYP